MSDQSQGPGWWQASDGKWYPPESARSMLPPPPTPPPAVPASRAAVVAVAVGLVVASYGLIDGQFIVGGIAGIVAAGLAYKSMTTEKPPAPQDRAVSDQSQGPGWWQASDGKWYPPGPQLLLTGSPTTERNAITLATISAVAAVLGVFLFFVFIPPLVAIVCGFAALKNFDRNGGPAAARWLATLAVFVGSLELLLAVFFIFVVGMYMNDMNDAGFAEPWATSEALRLTEFVLDRIPSGL